MLVASTLVMFILPKDTSIAREASRLLPRSLGFRSHR